MDREAINDWCEKAIVALVMALMVFAPLALGGNRTVPFLVIQGITIGVIALWAVRLWLSEKPRLLWPPVCWGVLAFMAYVVIRYFEAPVEYAGRDEMIRVLVFGSLFFTILNNVQKSEYIQAILFALIFVAMGISCYAGWQFFTKSKYVWNLPSEYVGRGSGTFIYPNHLAGFLEMLAPIGLCYAIMGRLPHVVKIVLGYASLVMLAGIGFTVSRGGWAVIGLTLFALCVVLLCLRDYRIHGLLLLVVLVGAGFFILPRAQLMQQRLNQMMLSGKADDLRLGIWKPAISMWRDNIWWGVGPAEFDYRFPQYRPPDVQLRPVYAHNDYLNTLTDYGVVGLGIIAITMLLALWGIFRVRESVRGALDDFSRKKSNKLALLIGASLGLLAIVLHSLVDFNMHMAAIAILAVALMAFLSTLWRYATDSYWWRLNVAFQGVVTVILLTAIIVLAGAGWRKGREYVALQRAEGQITPTNSHTYARITALEQAYKIEPKNFETSFQIAECYRLKSWEGGDDYVELAKKAMDWYQRATQLNPYDAYSWDYCGMCLDWIGPAQAGEDSIRYYQKANELDPNSYFITGNTGWHYMQRREWASARPWFERSRRLEWKEDVNPIAYSYLRIIEDRLDTDAARNK